MCECQNWQAQSMSKGSDGIWTTTLSLSPGSYGYKFLVNGSDWVFDPNNPNRKTVNGIENSAIEVAGENAASAPAPPTPSSTITSMSTSGTLAPTPGEILALEVPLSAKRRADAVKDGNSRLVHAKMAIAVPQSFDPQRSWPVLVISNTEAYSNIDSMQQLKQAAMDEGWVIMAADAVEAEKDQEGGPRWPTIGAAFDYITPQWPAMKDWPIATGGCRAALRIPRFWRPTSRATSSHHRLLMMGCNQDMATVAFHKSAPPGFLSAAVFISSGKSDKIATPAQHEDVKNSLRATGFQRVRLESFDSAHQIYQPHIGEALRWFTAQSPKSSTSPSRTSDWDKFFKKP